MLPTTRKAVEAEETAFGEEFAEALADSDSTDAEPQHTGASPMSANVGKKRYEDIFVTKKIAEYWLERNFERNRPEKRAQVPRYARDMAHGRWRDTGEPVIITPEGVMIDGGQRMRAVIRAAEKWPTFKGVTLTFCFNVEQNAVTAVDTGSGRTFGDILHMEHAVNRKQAGPIVRRVWTWRQGNLVMQRGSKNSFEDPSLQDLIDYYLQDRGGFDASTSRGIDIRIHKIGNSTAAGAAHYILSHIPGAKEDAEAFFDRLVSGKHGDEDRDPVWRLRERLSRSRDKSDSLTYLDSLEQLYLIMRAWNAFRTDELIDKLQLPPGRKITNENMPKPV